MPTTPGPATVRPMRRTDIPAAMRLKGLAGWNQTAADWKLLMRLEPEGCWVAEHGAEVVATTTAVNYGGVFGWIGMVIVDPAFRRRGIATMLIRHAVGYLESRRCRCQKLDATEAGAAVYRRMGFQVEAQVERWRRPAGLSVVSLASAPGVRELSPQDLPRIARLDRQAFGADRGRLLRWYCRGEQPGFLPAGETATGFVVGRAGSGAVQMGPLTARTAPPAACLMDAFLSRVRKAEIIADILAGHPAEQLLAEREFVRERVLHRMFRGERRSPNASLTYCLGGFELG